VHLVSLHLGEIDPPDAEVWECDASPCYWWIDDEGQLNIAMLGRRHDVWRGDAGHVEFKMSLVLGEPPAGSGRNYAITARSGRTHLFESLRHQRLNAYAGICGVTRESHDRLIGSFRIWMRPINNVGVISFLPQRPGSVLCFGTFNAVHDPERGQAIRSACEANGWIRRPLKPANERPNVPRAAPTTQPAAAP